MSRLIRNRALCSFEMSCKDQIFVIFEWLFVNPDQQLLMTGGRNCNPKTDKYQIGVNVDTGDLSCQLSRKLFQSIVIFLNNF